MTYFTSVEPFRFKQFSIHQDRCAMKIGTDGVLLGAWAPVHEVTRVLDIGAGCGVIAIMLAQRTENALIRAVEVDRASYAQAAENMRSAPWSDRLEAIHTSIQDYASEKVENFDLILSNPPFFTGGTFSTNNDRNIVRHAIKLPHGDLMAAVRTLLAEEGRFCVILPLIEGLRFQEMARTYHLFCNKVTEVKPKADRKVERLLMQFSKKEAHIEKDTLIIQQEGRNEWTKEYIELTRDFYLNM